MRQSHLYLARRILSGLAIEIAAGGRGRRRGIGHFAGVGGGAAHMRKADAEFGRHHLRDLGIQALAHFRAAMIYQHRAIGIDMHQCARLVVVHHIERDAEFGGRQRQPFLQHWTVGIEGAHSVTTLAIVAACRQFSDKCMNDVVFDRHAVMRGIACCHSIKIQFANIEGVLAQLAGDIVDDVLDHDCTLRPAEPAEGGVGLGIGFAGHGANFDVAQIVGVVDVA